MGKRGCAVCFCAQFYPTPTCPRQVNDIGYVYRSQVVALPVSCRYSSASAFPLINAISLSLETRILNFCFRPEDLTLPPVLGHAEPETAGSALSKVFIRIYRSSHVKRLSLRKYFGMRKVRACLAISRIFISARRKHLQ